LVLGRFDDRRKAGASSACSAAIAFVIRLKM